MTLIELRKLLCEQSGRFDLVVDYAAGNFSNEPIGGGADFYIQAGQKMLDSMPHQSRHGLGTLYVKLPSGAVSVAFKDSRWIDNVFVMDAAQSVGATRTQLSKRATADLYVTYSSLPSQLASGTPLYYAPHSMRLLPNGASIADLQSLTGFIDVPTSDSATYSGLLTYPPADKDYALAIRGAWWSPKLANDTDSNFWSEEHPDLLLMAAYYKMECVYRNTQGQKDLLYAIQHCMEQLDLDRADEDAAERDFMRELIGGNIA